MIFAVDCFAVLYMLPVGSCRHVRELLGLQTCVWSQVYSLNMMPLIGVMGFVCETEIDHLTRIVKLVS